ncbi:MAG: hypothetical protein V1859_05775 [archaeon]
MNFESSFRYLNELGVTAVILPFLLVFTIIYAVLYKSQILGEPKKPFNKIVALVIALAVIFPQFTGIGPNVVPIINNALPQVSIIGIAIIMFLILIGMWGVNVDIAGKSFGGWVVVLSMIAIAVIFANSAGWLPFIPEWTLSWIGDETMSLIIIILIFGVIISFITGEEKPEDKKESRLKMFEDVLGGGKH